MNETPLILVVDDDLLLLRATLRILDQAGYRTCHASDGLGGLQMVREQKPALTLLDVNLPDISGVEVCRLIKNDKGLAGCFVVLLSGARIDTQSQVEGLEGGADGYIPRPVANAELLARVRGMLRIQQAEATLRIAEAGNRDIVDNATVGIFQSTPQGQFSRVNPFMARIYGYASPEEMVASITDISRQIYADPDGRQEFQRILAEKGQVSGFVGKNYRKDQSIVWTETTARVLKDAQGQILFYEGFITDVSERKQAEDALRESGVQYQLLADHMNDMVWLMNMRLQTTYISPSVQKLRGYTLEEIRNSRLEQMLTPASAKLAKDVFHAEMPRIMADPTYKLVRTLELEFFRKDGSTFWSENKLSIIRDQDGNPVSILGEGRDISERKIMEEALRKSKNQYDNLVSNIPIGIYILRSTPQGTSSFEYVSPKLAEMYNVSVESFLTNPQVSFEPIHPDDLESLVKLNQERFQHPQQFEWEGRAIFGGVTRWLRIASSPEPLENGEVLWHGTVTDTTKSKLAEIALKDSEERFRGFLEEVHLVSVQGYGPDGTTQYWNLASERLYGYSSQEAIGRNLLDLIIPAEMRTGVRQAMRQMAETGQPIPPAELSLMRKDGSRVMVFSSHAIVQIPGLEQELFCIDIDITERKAAEEKIRLLNMELEQLASTDGLTSVHNHRSLLKLAEREFDVAMRYRPPLSMMFFDIDNFKQINDTFGHGIGDEALKKVIQTVCMTLRSADMIGRYGGDEFVILLPQTSAQDAMPLAERIHASIAGMRLDTNKGPLTLTISIGIAQSIRGASQADSVESLMLRADQALYAAKQAGKNCTRIL